MLIAREALSGREVKDLPDTTSESLLEALDYIPDAPISPMYRDKTDGRTVQVGWCIAESEYTEGWGYYTSEPVEFEEAENGEEEGAA